MKKYIFSLLIFAFVVIYQSAMAQDQNIETSESLSIISTKDTTIEIVKEFQTTSSLLFTDPQVPRYLIYDKKRDVAFGIGGYFSMRAMYDFDGSPTSGASFIPYSIDLKSNSMTRNQIRLNASHSTIFFKVLGNNSKIGQFQAYISGNFSGKNNSFILDDAYIKLLGFTIGRTWSTFNDLAVVPPTVDFQGPNGAAKMRTEQIRYSGNLSKDLSFGVAVEMPQSTGRYGQSINDLEMSPRIPDIPLYLQYSFGENQSSHIRVAGVLRNMNYLNEINNKTEYATAVGMQVSTKTSISPLFTFYGQLTYGKGTAQYISDLQGVGLSLVADASNNGKMKAVETMGWLTQLQINISKKLYTTFGYSQASVLSKTRELALPESTYHYGQYIVGNVFYAFTKDIQMGAEYVYGKRVDMDGSKGSANRVQAMIQLNF